MSGVSLGDTDQAAMVSEGRKDTVRLVRDGSEGVEVLVQQITPRAVSTLFQVSIMIVYNDEKVMFFFVDILAQDSISLPT